MIFVNFSKFIPTLLQFRSMATNRMESEDTQPSSYPRQAGSPYQLLTVRFTNLQEPFFASPWLPVDNELPLLSSQKVCCP